MEYDLHSNVKGVLALAVQNIISDTTTVGAIIDTQGFESLEYLITSGTVTDGVYTFLLEEGDDSGLSDAAAVPAANLLGSLTGFILTDDDTVKRVGTNGKKRYQRLSIVSTGTTSGGTNFTATAVQGNPKTGPVAEQ